MTPLRICFLWHQHQPDYRAGDEFFLPWVRMHAAKDYSNLPTIMRDYTLKHTINVVPSMLFQLKEYKNGRMDPLDKLMGMAPSTFSPRQKRELWQWAETIQLPTMAKHLPELKSILKNSSVEQITEQQIVDLQVLICLAWIGPVHRRSQAKIQELESQGRNFQRSDLTYLREVHQTLMDDLVPLLSELQNEGQIEISVTPYHHPILPLLCDTNVARESTPDARVPDPHFSSLDDAQWHIKSAIDYWKSVSGQPPVGMWPAEGSISMQALELLAGSGVKWAASDEGVLKNSLSEWHKTAPYHPYQVETKSGQISVLFRDHALSDAIGFEYSTWEPEDAAENFVSRLRERRESIIQEEGQGALEDAVVPIMLDGENCWEFYPENGEPFLRALFSKLESDPMFTSVTCAEAVRVTNPMSLTTVKAGSWINSSFDVWIGSDTKNLAWDLVRQAREQVQQREEYHDLMDLIYTLEASDWFWWYDDRHQAPHKLEFDRQFRLHLSTMFNRVEVEPPVDLAVPLYQSTAQKTSGSDYHQVSYGNNTMHDANAIIKTISLDTESNWQRITFELQREMTDNEEVVATIKDRLGNERRCAIMKDETLFQSELHDEGFDRDEHNNARVFLRATTEWIVTLEEQREGGGSHTTTVNLSI